MFTVILDILFNMVLKAQVERERDPLLSSACLRLSSTRSWQLVGLPFHELLKCAGQLTLGSIVGRGTLRRKLRQPMSGASPRLAGETDPSPYKSQVSP